jgi:PqqD family protein of HPr-rel-A system
MNMRPTTFPKARTADLITETVGDELVVYDGKSSEAHCLSALAAAVFVAADGETSPADLAAIASRQLSITVDVPEVEQALVELEDRGLIDPMEISGLSRRGFMQRSAVVGGAVVAGSLVTSVVTPAYGSTGSLPLGVPCNGFSSLAIQISDGSGNVYGAHWAAGTANNSNPSDFGTTQANSAAWGNGMKGCPTTPWTVTSSGWPSGVTEPILTDVPGGICISLPPGYTILQYAAFFGKGATGTCGLQCLTGGTPTKAACGYLITFDVSCYSGC